MQQREGCVTHPKASIGDGKKPGNSPERGIYIPGDPRNSILHAYFAEVHELRLCCSVTAM
jgi:hypothetical protein